MLPGIERVLVVDDSRLMRQLLAALLSPHCERVHVASSAKDAISVLEAREGVDLVVTDVYMDGGASGLEVLDHVAELPGEAPRVVLITARFSEAHAHAAERVGAGYLVKPISLQQLRLCVKISPRNRSGLAERGRCTLARAWVVDPEHASDFLLDFDVHDLSGRGALLETRGPLPVGTRLQLELLLGGRRVRATGRVVRVQTPSWLGPGGSAIAFESVDSQLEQELEAFLAATAASRPSR